MEGELKKKQKCLATSIRKDQIEGNPGGGFHLSQTEDRARKKKKRGGGNE